MKIYKVNTEHKKFGPRWNDYRIDARSCEEAIRKAKKKMMSRERVESVEVLASTED